MRSDKDFMDARGDLVGPRPLLQRSIFVCPHPETFGVAGGVIPQISFASQSIRLHHPGAHTLGCQEYLKMTSRAFLQAQLPPQLPVTEVL
jgi:hypothetical protein